MRHIASLLALVLCLALAPAAFSADWPQFLGPSANGVSPDKGINKNWKAKAPRQVWRFNMSDSGYSGPSVAGGKLFIIDHQGNDDIVRALDTNTGKEKWTFRYSAPGTNNYGFARATPTVNGGKVYTLGRDGWLHCLDAGSGRKVWVKNLIREFGGKQPGWLLSMSPYIDGNKLIVCPGGKNAAVAALDKNSGNVLWKGGGSDTPGYATPVVATIDRVRQYVIFTAWNLIGVDANNGKLLWSFPWKTGSDVNAATPIVFGNSIFIASGYGHGCALVDIKGNRATARWQNREIQAHFSSPIAVGGYIYGIGDPGYLVCLDMKTGKTRWKQMGFEKGGLVGVDGALIAFNGANGDLIMANMSPDRYTELGRFKPLGGQSWTAPIVANGKLYVRNKSTLACYDLK